MHLDCVQQRSSIRALVLFLSVLLLSVSNVVLRSRLVLLSGAESAVGPLLYSPVWLVGAGSMTMSSSSSPSGTLRRSLSNAVPLTDLLLTLFPGSSSLTPTKVSCSVNGTSAPAADGPLLVSASLSGGHLIRSCCGHTTFLHSLGSGSIDRDGKISCWSLNLMSGNLRVQLQKRIACWHL